MKLPIKHKIVSLHFLFALLTSNIYAAQIDVNTNLDTKTNNDGLCSLREAIISANTDNGGTSGCVSGSGTDTILLKQATYSLTIQGANEDGATTGDLDINSQIVITGKGSNLTIINAPTGDRIFHVTGSDYGLEVSALTLQNANHTQNGGAIYVNQGTLTVRDTEIKNNHASSGGGIYGNNSNINIYFSTISNNDTGEASYGGGIYMYGGIFYLQDSTVNTNIANSLWDDLLFTPGRGGGIYSSGTIMTILRSSISNNFSGYGAGLQHCCQPLYIEDSIFTENYVAAESGYGGCAGLSIGGLETILVNVDIMHNTSDSNLGGGLCASGGSEIINSNITDNQASDGAGIYGSNFRILKSTITNNIALNFGNSGDGAGIYIGYNSSYAELISSTISNNTANRNGGGIYIVQGSTLTVTSSTISSNTALVGQGKGGGIYLETSTGLDLTNTTITNNQSVSSGGGIYAAGTPTVSLSSNIIANNTNTAAPNCYAGSNIWTSAGGNLIGNNKGCNFTSSIDLVGTEQTPINPLLSSLGDYGGPTSTHTLAFGSPAIDLLADCPTEDQRGLVRPFTSPTNLVGLCDGGATESQFNLPKIDITPTPETIEQNDPWYYQIDITSNNPPGNIADLKLQLLLPSTQIATYQQHEILLGNGTCNHDDINNRLDCSFTNVDFSNPVSMAVHFTGTSLGTATLLAKARFGNLEPPTWLWQQTPSVSSSVLIDNKTDYTVLAQYTPGMYTTDEAITIDFHIANLGPLPAPNSLFEVFSKNSGTKIVSIAGTGCPPAESSSLICHLGDLSVDGESIIQVGIQAYSEDVTEVDLGYELSSDYDDLTPDDSRGDIIMTTYKPEVVVENPPQQPQTPENEEPTPNNDNDPVTTVTETPDDESEEIVSVADSKLRIYRMRSYRYVAINLDKKDIPLFSMSIRPDGTEPLEIQAMTLNLATLVETARQDHLALRIYYDNNHDEQLDAQDTLFEAFTFKPDQDNANSAIVLNFAQPETLAPGQGKSYLIMLANDQIKLASLKRVGDVILSFPLFFAGMMSMNRRRYNKHVFLLLSFLVLTGISNCQTSKQRQEDRYQFNLEKITAVGTTSGKSALVEGINWQRKMTVAIIY